MEPINTLKLVKFWTQRALAYHAQGDWVAYRNVVGVIDQILGA